MLKKTILCRILYHMTRLRCKTHIQKFKAWSLHVPHFWEKKWVVDGTASCACAASASPAALLGDTGSCAVSARCPIPVMRWGVQIHSHEVSPMYFPYKHEFQWYTLQEINISHLGKRKIIFKMDFSRDMLVPRRVYIFHEKKQQYWAALEGQNMAETLGNYCQSCPDLESKPMKAWIGPQSEQFDTTSNITFLHACCDLRITHSTKTCIYIVIETASGIVLGRIQAMSKFENQVVSTSQLPEADVGNTSWSA